MITFGDRLRSEREERGLSIRAVAEALGVADERLRALERNDFRALPGNDTIVPCLRAYADCLRVDAELMIEDYVRERDRCLATLEQAVSAEQQQASVAVPAPLPWALTRRPTIPRWAVALGIVAIVLLGAWWMLSGDGARRSPDPLPATPPNEAVAQTSEAEPPAAPSVAREAVGSATATAAGARLAVAEQGVGTGVERRQLTGRAERFPEGIQVWYWTRVEAGRVGDRIEHVWYRNGVEAERTSLRIGGSPWRTFSAKMLRAGSAGPWVVETRDAENRVLARQEFACVR